MEGSWNEFERVVRAILERFFQQGSRALPASDALQFTAQLRRVVAEREWPRPLADDELGAPGSMGESECAPLVARIVAGLDEALFADVARQFVKACFYPEFKVCRDSFREVTRDGACRRQEQERVRSRISGTHCVDCPHWVALAPGEHADFLARNWRKGPDDFQANRALFLPEDFRALRCWLQTAARQAHAARSGSTPLSLRKTVRRGT